jgi:UDP-N-acetylglucosamine 2-epimerase (non-hydrolysing)
MRIVHVVGTRPNFVKMAPVIAATRDRFGADSSVTVHTGQHYDRAMSEIFFAELGVPEPDHMLGVGSGPHGEQTARVLERLEPVLRAERPDLVLVPGDVNSTLAAALCADRLGIRIGHVESGLRSFDRTMPEEINRVVTDHLSELLFLHSPEAEDNLRAEGVPEQRFEFVGNTMIDTLVALEHRFRAREAAATAGVEPGSFLLVTLHRPALVDGPLLIDAIAALERVAAEMPVLFPVHPRTRKMLGSHGAGTGAVRLTDPIGYLDFLSLEADAAAVLTDSGGIQEETTYLGVPCFTLRDNTERPVTVRAGTNTLLGLAPERILEIPGLLAATPATRPQPPQKWDGHAARRLTDVLTDR